MKEEIAPLIKLFSGVYDLWYFDGRRETKQLNQLEAYRLMNNGPEDLIGMRRRIKIKYKNGKKNQYEI